MKESDFDLEDFPEAHGGHYNNYVDYDGDIEDNS